MRRITAADTAADTATVMRRKHSFSSSLYHTPLYSILTPLTCSTHQYLAQGPSILLGIPKRTSDVVPRGATRCRGHCRGHAADTVMHVPRTCRGQLCCSHQRLPPLCQHSLSPLVLTKVCTLSLFYTHASPLHRVV